MRCMPIYLYGSLQWFADVRSAHIDSNSISPQGEACAAPGVSPRSPDAAPGAVTAHDEVRG